MTVAEQVQILAKATGLDIEVREAATPAQAVQPPFPNGAPPALAEAITEGFALMRADTVGFRTEGVTEAGPPCGCALWSTNRVLACGQAAVDRRNASALRAHQSAKVFGRRQ